MLNKNSLRNFLGELPLAAELDYTLRQKNRARKDHYNLSKLQKMLPQGVAQAKPFIEKYTERGRSAGKKILFFATLHYWIEQAAYISLTLSGLGHRVTLLTLPYSEWHKEKDKLTQRQRVLHTRDALSALAPYVQHASFLELKPASDLPASLKADIEEISLWDAQYTLMREEVDMKDKGDKALYDLRIKRNTFAALAALEWMQTNKPDVVLIPNGLILEMGIVFRVVRYLNIPVMTFEFNDQREQIWLAQNTSIMQQDTDYLVRDRCSLPMTDEMYERLADLENARRGARVWGKSKRLWQYVSSQGAEAIRKALGLDDRPIVLLAANVLGDSLTLGRNIFAESMSEWITRTVQYFAKRTDVQLVVRVHPGEKIVPQAKSMGTVVREALPELPSHIHVIGALDNVNTYDLIEIANLGLAYTTTVGVETAMNGIPVISCGQTHYRSRGFTLDPNTWDEYFSTLEKVLSDLPAHRLTEEQTAKAWNYAYRFFFEYPRPFPWRLMNFWDDLEVWPLERVLGDEGMSQFGDTFKFLVGIHLEIASSGRSPPRNYINEKKIMAENTKQQVREFYDQIGWSQAGAGLYQNARYEDLRPVSREYIHKCHMRVKRYISPSGEILLDAGSGPVQWPEYLTYSEDYRYRLCADISITALKEARNRLGDRGLFVVADIANLPFKPGAFDGVVSMHTIHHLPLNEHKRAYAELTRVLKYGQSGAIINGWHNPLLMKMAEPFIALGRFLTGRSAKKKKDWSSEEDQSGTFVEKMTPRWLKNELKDVVKFEIYPWRSLSPRFMRWFVRPQFGGKIFLRFVFWLEETFPRFFGENGQYPLIVIKK